MTVPMMPAAQEFPNEPEFYKDPQGYWRWRRVSTNGEVYAASHEGFRSKWGAKRNYKRSRR